MNLEQANPNTNSNSGAEESDGASATSTASESVLSRSNKRKKCLQYGNTSKNRMIRNLQSV